MSETLIALVIGILSFVTSQFIENFIINPFKSYREVIGEIVHATNYYANADSPLEVEPYEAVRTLRGLSGKLLSSAYAIPAYEFWAALDLVPKMESVVKASAELIGYSNRNARSNSDVVERTRRIAQYLKIKVLIKKYGKPQN